MIQKHQKRPQKICQQTLIFHNSRLKLFAMYQTQIKIVDDCKYSSVSPMLKPDNRRYSLYTITCRAPCSHLLPVLGRKQIFPTNMTATIDSHLTFVLTSKLLLQSTCSNKTVKCCRQPLKLSFPNDGKEKTKPPGLSSSFAPNLIQFLRPWSTSKRNTDTEPRKTDDSHWVIVPAFKPLLKWKCVSSFPPFPSFLYLSLIRTNMKVWMWIHQRSSRRRRWRCTVLRGRLFEI